MIKNIDMKKEVKLNYSQKLGESKISFNSNLNKIDFDVMSGMEDEFSIFSQKLEKMKSGEEIEIPNEFKSSIFQSQIMKIEIL